MHVDSVNVGMTPSGGLGSADPIYVRCECVHGEVVLLAVCVTGVLVGVACSQLGNAPPSK